jgi:hypothetical protein
MSKKDRKKKLTKKVKRSLGKFKAKFKAKSKKIRRKIKRSIKRSFQKTIKKIKSNILISERMKKKYGIVDVPLDKETNKGTKASSNFVDYDYQRLNNIIRFIHSEMKQRNDIYYFKPLEDSFIEVNIITKEIKPSYLPQTEYIENIKKSVSKRYIPITVNIQLPTHSHANVILIDNELKNIEYFEPHGYKKEESTLESIENAVGIKLRLLKLFFSKLLPDYKFINVGDYFKRQGFQMKHDARHGYCVTWSIIYVHYRFLNPSLPINILIKYLYYHITRNKLLRYARYIEKVLKL